MARRLHVGYLALLFFLALSLAGLVLSEPIPAGPSHFLARHPLAHEGTELLEPLAPIVKDVPTAESSAVTATVAPTTVQAASVTDTGLADGEEAPYKATTSQLLLLVCYVVLVLWAGFWEIVTLLRVMRGLEPFISHHPHHHALPVVRPAEEAATNGEPAAVNGEERAAKPKETVKPEGATTFFPRFSPFEYTPEIQQVARSAVLFGALLLLFFLVDGPFSHFGPDDRKYSRDFFIFICLSILVMGFLTLRDTHKKNSAILNREQTEEWKGFMQIGFVLYHYYAAKETYNIIRVFIAAYVWMTGFGNFSYFWIRKDYSFVRLAKMLIRLNWLVFFVCLVMDKEYMLYYVCPLHTFYFLVVYATMAICPEANYEPMWMRIKFLMCFLFLFIVFEVPGIFELFFWPLDWLLSYQNSLHEWKFRSTLDHYAVLIGMLYAYNYPAIEAMLKRLEQSVPKVEYAIKSVILGISLAVFVAWMAYYVPMDKYEYNALHPYISVIPYTGYIILRNISFPARSKVLGLFQWSGRITLETYIAQFHLWLVHDAKGRLVYVEDYPLVNFIIATAVYLFASSLLFDTTVTLNDALIPPGTNSVNATRRLAFYVIAWGVGFTALATLRGVFAF